MKWTRSPPMSACGLPSRSYSQNDDGALAMAASTTSRGKWIRPFASSGSPWSTSRWRISGPRISMPVSDSTRIASSTMRVDELGLQDVQAGSHARKRSGTGARRDPGGGRGSGVSRLMRPGPCRVSPG